MHFSGGFESFSDILGVLNRGVSAITRSVRVFEKIYLQIVVFSSFYGDFSRFFIFFLDFSDKVVLYS